MFFFVGGKNTRNFKGKKNICKHEEKKITLLFIMSVKALEEGGLKALTDMSAGNVSFLWTAPRRRLQ